MAGDGRRGITIGLTMRRRERLLRAAIPQPHARAAAISRNKLDAGLFEGAHHLSDSVPVIRGLRLRSPDCVAMDAGLL